MHNKRQKQSSSFKPSLHQSSLRPQNSRLVLEPRIVFDAALPIAGQDMFDQTQMQADFIVEQPEEILIASQPAPAQENIEENSVETNAIATQDRPLIDGTLAPTNLTASEIIFIDAIVSDLQQYITDHPNADVVLLDSSKDGLAQIAAVLNGRTGIESVHILSHGTSGQLNLGNATIDLTVLKSQYSAELAIIQSALTENADILIYGCDVAAGDAGAAFVGYLASATGADIAASTDLTGAADLGGNWALETKAATVESASLDLANWNGLLTPVNTGLWAISAAANTATVPVTATNTTDGVTTTVTFSGPNNAWTGSVVEKLITDAAFNTGTANTASAFTNAAAGIDSIRTVFAGGVTGTVTITFSKPVINPTIHLDRLGGLSGTSNTSIFTLATGGASLTKLSGSGHLLVGGAGANGSTGITIQRTTGATSAANGGEASSSNALGTAAGSVVVTGAGGAAQLFTSITFNVTGAADGIEMAFTFDAPPVATNDTFVSVGNATVTGNIVTGNNGGGVDSDFKGDAISMTRINGAAFTVGTPIALANGTLTITNATTGAFTFVPNAGFLEAQTFTYTIADPNGGTSTATVTINADTDGDGVVNSTDLDDDNDGIMDVNEGFSQRFEVWHLFDPNFIYNDGTMMDAYLQVGSLGGAYVDLFPSDARFGALTNNPDNFNNLAFDNGKFYVVRADGNLYFTNDITTGNFTLLGNANLPTSAVNLANDNGVFYHVALASGVPTLYSSTNPASNGWTALGAINVPMSQISDIAVDNGVFYALEVTNAASGTHIVRSSTNPLNVGAAWSVVGDPGFGTNVGNFGIGTTTITRDSDGDGRADHLDLDSDNDGISDLSESTGGTGDALADTNNNGTVSLAESVAAGATGDGDIDNDGLMDIFDANTANTTGAVSLGNTPINSDGDSRANYLDLDSDNDGIADTVEARLTAGYVANDGNVSNNDADKDGVIDIFDSNDGTTRLFGGTFTAPVNTDGADLVDYLDTDSDNDGKLDSAESGLSTVTTDANGDGIRDSVNASYTDPDGLVNNPQVNLANQIGTTSEVGYREMDTAPVNTVPPAQTTTEDTAKVFSIANGNAITINDVDGGLQTVTLTAANGIMSLGGVAGLTSVTGNGTGTITLTGSIANINAALNGLSFVPRADYNNTISPTSPASITIKTVNALQVVPNFINGGFEQGSTTGTFEIVAETLVPGWDTNASDNQIEIWRSGFQGVPAYEGNYFAEIFANVPSTLFNTFTPIAGSTISVDFAHRGRNGTDEMQIQAIDLGADGVLGGTGANADAVLFTQNYSTSNAAWATYTANITNNASGNVIQFGFTGVSTFGGNFVDGIVLKQAAPASDTDTILIDVTPVKDTVTDNLSTQEDTPITFNVLTGNNGASADNFEGSPIVSSITQPAAGTGTVSFAANGSMTYTPPAGFSGSTSYTYTVTSPAGVTETETINITVNNVNEAPSGTDNLNIAGTEDTPVTITKANFGFSDTVDAVPNAFTNVIITSLPLATEGVYQLNGSNIAINQIISVAQIDAGLLKFVPANGVSGNDLGALGFRVQDNGGVANGGIDTDPTANTLAIDIVAVNDAPAGADKTVTTTEDGAYTFTAADFGFTDPNDTPANALQSVIITTLPPSGVLFLNGVAVTAGQVIPATSIGLLTWVPPLNGNGNALSSFTFQVVDDGATGGANQNTDQSPNTITFNVTPVNDAPVDGDETNTVTEDITLTVADGGTGDLLNNATDVDGNPLSITGYTIAGIAGTQAVGAPVLIAGVGTVTINANGSYSFAPVANYAGAVPVITYTVSDGTLTDTSTLSLSITPVNDVPVDGDETNTLTEDTTLTIADGAPGDLLNNATDTEGNLLTISGFTIAGVAGFQAVNTPVVIAGVGTITINDNGSYSFVPAANYTGAIPLITYSVNDGAGGIDTSTLSLGITAVNDAPAGTDNTSTVNEDTVYTVTAADFGFTDPNDAVPNTLANVIITSLPTDGSGEYQLNGLPIAINQVISAADINAGLLKFVPTPNFNGSGIAALGFQVQDNGGTALGGADTDPTPNTFKLNITPVDDVVTITGLNNGPAGTGSDAQVKESDLATGTTPAGTGENASGSFNLGAPSALSALTINGTAITKVALIDSSTTPIVINTANGTLTINGYNSTTGEVTYSYALNSPANNSAPADNLNKNDNFNIVVTDVENQTTNATLAINILDDLPIANADTDEVINLGGTADGNVYTGAGGTDSNNSDGSADIIGADGAVAGSPSPVTGVAAGAGAPVAGNLGGAGVAGTYGNLVLNANGSYVYTPSATNPTVTGLAPGATLTDTFTYSIKDADGDTVSTTLTVTIVGVPAVTGLGDGTVAGTDGSVLESDLAAGTNAAGTGEKLNGGFALNAPLGVQTLSIKPTGQAAVVLSLADLNALSVTPRTFTTANGTLTLTGFNVLTGQVDYTYVLTTPVNSSGSPTDDFEVILRDNSPNGGVATTPRFLKIAILDDAPIANPDTANINENSTNITGNVVTASDLIGADGSTGSNNPVTGVIAGNGTPTGSVGSAVAGSYGSITLAANGSYTYTLNNANATVNALNVGQNLTETFTYKITDKDGDVSTTTLTITIDGVNDAPVVNPDTATTLEDTPVSGNVLSNDSDADSILTVTQFTIAGDLTVYNAGDTATIPGVGTLTIGATGGYTFTPVAGYNGTVPVATYTVNDGSGQPNATAQSTLSLTVTSVNDAPQGADNTISTLEDTPVSLNAASFGFTDSNDTPANALQSVIITTLPAAGTLKLNGVNVTAGQVITAANLANLTFTPPLNGSGTAISSMTFQVVDNGGTANGGQNTDQSPNTITFDVTSVNDAPAGADKTVTINEDQAYLVTAADFGFTDANDSPANSLANIIITTLPPAAQGQYLLNGVPVTANQVISVADINAGLFTFNPAANLNGSNLGALGFRVQDDGGTANGGVNTDPTANTLKFNITAVNDVPVATDDNVTTNEDTPVTLNLLGNDTDADGDTLSIKSINGVAITPGTAQTITVPNGQVTVSATGVVTFEPNPNYFGPVTFDYVVQDGKGGEDTGTVNVTVTSVNDKPTPAVDVASTPEDTPVSGNVLSNDTDADNDTLNVTQFTIPGVGTFTAGQTATIPGKGTLTIDSSGNYTFNPVLNFNGALPVVTYTVTDSSGAANQTATSTLSLTVTPVNDAPVATPINPSGNEDTPISVSLAGTDVDGTVVSVTVTALPPVTEGILYLADGTTPVDIGSPLTPAQAAGLIFKPAPNFNGTVTPITFTVKDNQGLDSAPAAANITIAAVIDLPVAISGSTNTPEDTNAAVSLTATDVDGTIASIRVTVLPTPAEGVLYYADGVTPVLTTDVISPADAATLIFAPTTNFNGLVNVKFTALDNDGNLSANVGNFLIDVADVNDAPIATPTTVNGTEDVTANVSLTGTDIDGTVTKVTVDTLPPVTQGILYLADGVTPVVAGQPLTPAQAASLKFDPAPNFNGTVTIPFTVTDDDNELSTPANLIINIGAVNDAPDANPDTQTVAEDTPASGNVIANDTDAEGSALNVTQFNVPGVGTVAAGTTAIIPGVGTILITANGEYTFTPVLNFNGNVPQITYTVSDGVNATNTTLNITVTSVNDPPAALATSPTGNEDTPIPVKLLGTDVDGTIASVTIASLPPATDGILTFANGTPVPVGTTITPAQAAGLIFVPAPNFNGTVTIPFTVTDNQGATSSPADAVITVVPVNDPPVATPTIATGNEDTPIPLNLTGTDVEGPIASVTIASLPPTTQGILTLADGTPVVAGVPLTPAQAAGLIFTPAPNFNGVINIPFKVTDADGTTSTPANATINVVSVNDPPVAIGGSVNTAEDTNARVNLRGTDVDGTVTSITVTSLPDPSQGVLTFANGTPVIANVPMTPAQAAGLIFNPTANYNGVVTVLFTAADNIGAISTPASFVIDVAAVDDDPVATPTSPSGPEDTPLPVSLTGTDVEGPITAVTVVSLPPASQGILTKADGTPVVAGQPLTPAEAADLIFVPAPNFNGSVNIPFTVTDSVGQVSSPPTVAALTIVPVNDLPVAIPSTPSGNEDTPIPVSLTGTDVDGTVTKVTIVTPPSNGTLTLNGVPVVAGQELTPAQAASLVFNPAPNFVGSVDVVFTVTDNNNGESIPATTTITVNDVVSPPVGNGTTVGGSSEDVISVPLGGSDADGTIVSVTVQSLPPASQGTLTLADGTPVVVGVPLTPAQAAGLIFTPAPGANGTVNIVFTVTDDEGLVSSPATTSIVIQDVAILFEQLLAPPAKLNFEDPNRPDPFAVHSPVIPIGMPEDLFVTHSVRESAMRIAQSSNFGLFNVDTPTRGELDNLTYDLKGLPVGMDPTLFVQHAVRHLPVTQEPRLFVQNAVRQSQLESTLRNIGTNSFNTATNGVLSLMSPFDLGSTNDAADLSVDAVQGEFVEPETQATQATDEKQAKNLTPEQDLTVLERQKVAVNKTLSTKAMPQKVAAAGFAQQLSLAAKRLKTTDVFKNTPN